MRLLTLFACFLTALAAPAHSADTNSVAPDWVLESIDGESVRLSEEVQKQPVVLFFWATWCPYCKALMPHLQSMRLEYGEEIRILAIHFRDDKDPVAYIQGTGYDFTVLPNGDEVAKLYEVWGTPGIVVVDQQQQMRFDLRALPALQPPAGTNSGNHKSKAAYRAPYWAAAIRMALDRVLEENER